MATTWQSINILNFFILKKKKILTSSKVECVIPINFPTYPTYLNTSFFLFCCWPTTLSLSLSLSLFLRFCLVGRWKSEIIENRGRMEKWEDRKVFSFPHLCSVERVEKWRDGKLLGLVENEVCINLPSCPS